MAITAPTLANPNGGAQLDARIFSGGNSDDDNDVIFTLDADGFNKFTFGSTAGAVDVLVSLDGTNFLSTAVYFNSLISATPATQVNVTAANGLYVLTGRFAKVRFLQNGATDVENFTVVASRE